MNVVHVLVSAVTESAPETRRDAIDDREEETVGTDSAATTPKIIEHDTVSTSEDQVLTVLDAYEGRIRQQDVVAETGFSAATVSRLLSKLEDDGQIARLHKGREKIVVDPELLPPALTAD